MNSRAFKGPVPLKEAGSFCSLVYPFSGASRKAFPFILLLYRADLVSDIDELSIAFLDASSATHSSCLAELVSIPEFPLVHLELGEEHRSAVFPVSLFRDER